MNKFYGKLSCTNGKRNFLKSTAILHNSLEIAKKISKILCFSFIKLAQIPFIAAKIQNPDFLKQRVFL
jgi:hypothetical protein